MIKRFILVYSLALLSAGCTHAPAGSSPDSQLALYWVRDAGEYRAVSLQVYRQAELDLPRLIADPDWSALPGQESAQDLPPAVIFDVDDTVVSGAAFQFTLDTPFSNAKHEAWNASHAAIPVPGFYEFAKAARAAGVALFFVTNRPCEPVGDDPCPQERTAIEDVREAGIETDADHMMLAFEQPGWGKEKITRREHVAATHRVIMLFGDDLGDFIPCTRARPARPCTEGATIASRNALIDKYRDRFGHGWYILPNPMYGSWTTVE